MESKLKEIKYDGFTTCPGNRIQPIFKRRYIEEQKRELVVQDGEIDIYQEIQESDNQSDIVMLKKMIKGDPNMAPQDETAVYSDSSLFPNNIHELYQADEQTKANYAKLPDSAKKIFPTIESFKSALMDGSYYTKLSEGYQQQAAAAAKAAAAAAKSKTEGENE